MKDITATLYSVCLISNTVCSLLQIANTLVCVVIKIPNLRWDVFARSNIENLHALSVTRVKTLPSVLVDDLPLLGVGPLLVPALAVARRHLHLLTCPRKWIGHGGARVLASQLELPGEGDKLSCCHEVVTNILTQVITKINNKVLHFKFCTLLKKL